MSDERWMTWRYQRSGKWDEVEVKTKINEHGHDDPVMGDSKLVSDSFSERVRVNRYVGGGFLVSVDVLGEDAHELVVCDDLPSLLGLLAELRPLSEMANRQDNDKCLEDHRQHLFFKPGRMDPECYICNELELISIVNGKHG